MTYTCFDHNTRLMVFRRGPDIIRLALSAAYTDPPQTNIELGPDNVTFESQLFTTLNTLPSNNDNIIIDLLPVATIYLDNMWSFMIAKKRMLQPIVLVTQRQVAEAFADVGFSAHLRCFYTVADAAAYYDHITL